jgi:hypothetical protein
MHLFVSESLVSAVLYIRVKAGGAAPSQAMSRGQVIYEASFLSRLLQNEFVYGTDGLEINVDRTIAAMEKDEVIAIEGGMIGLSAKERATGREGFDFYNFLLWPFIETYWLAAVSLFALTPVGVAPSPDATVAWYAEKEFHASAQFLGNYFISSPSGTNPDFIYFPLFREDTLCSRRCFIPRSSESGYSLKCFLANGRIGSDHYEKITGCQISSSPFTSSWFVLHSIPLFCSTQAF